MSSKLTGPGKSSTPRVTWRLRAACAPMSGARAVMPSHSEHQAHAFPLLCVRGVYAYQQACPMCRDDTPLQLTPRRRTDEDVYNWRPLEDWLPHHFAIVGACTKCGETIYYGQHTRISVTRQQYHTYSCPTPEMNAILRALAAEYEDSEIYTGRDSHWGYQRDPDWGIN